MTGVDLLGFLTTCFKPIIYLCRWIKFQYPIYKLLGPIAQNKNLVRIFVRDLYVNENVPNPLIAQEGANGIRGYVPNIGKVWPAVEGKGIGYIFSVLGSVGKKEKIEIVEMGDDTGLWNSNLIILGAQTQKCFDFYEKMKNVAYGVDRQSIFDYSTKKPINFESGYGYGVILKCKNPFGKSEQDLGFLIGGFGVLGTQAAGYYFMRNASKLGKEFKKSCFGIVVKASVSAGVQSTERLSQYDKKL